MDEIAFRKECLIECYTNASYIVHVKVTHMPTGLWEERTGTGQFRTRNECIAALQKRVSQDGEG